MQPDYNEQAEAFYRALISKLSDMHPRFREKGIGFFDVAHPFLDKIPLTRVLMEEDLLVGMTLKASSSIAQPEIAKYLREMLEEKGIYAHRSETTYPQSLEIFQRYAGPRQIVIRDHGGYLSHSVATLKNHFGEQLIGISEHTLNGQQRLLKRFARASHQIGLPFVSGAHEELKTRSDREIAQSIALRIVETSEELGKPLLSARSDHVIILYGYGVMGLHAAEKLREMGCKGELIITDTAAKKRLYAKQDGFEIIDDLETIQARADGHILATNVTNESNPVLNETDFLNFKEGAWITSMTSMDDETRKDQLQSSGFLNRVGEEHSHGIYKLPNGKEIFLIEDGRPTNVSMPDGGVGKAICVVEGAGLASAFMTVDIGRQTTPEPAMISEEHREIIAELATEHLYCDAS